MDKRISLVLRDSDYISEYEIEVSISESNLEQLNFALDGGCEYIVKIKNWIDEEEALEEWKYAVAQNRTHKGFEAYLRQLRNED